MLTGVSAARLALLLCWFALLLPATAGPAPAPGHFVHSYYRDGQDQEGELGRAARHLGSAAPPNLCPPRLLVVAAAAASIARYHSV